MSELSTTTSGESQGAAPRRWARAIVFAVAIGFAGFAIAAVVSGGYQVRPILSGSMRPGLPVGGVVVTQRVPVGAINNRDVIVFAHPNDPAELVVHRVISLTRTGSTLAVKTQGDANNAPDPWTLNLSGRTAYRAIYTVPLVGYPAVWLQRVGGRGSLLLAAGLAIIFAMMAMWREDKRDASASRPESAPDDDQNPPDPTASDVGELMAASQ